MRKVFLRIIYVVIAFILLSAIYVNSLKALGSSEVPYLEESDQCVMNMIIKVINKYIYEVYNKDCEVVEFTNNSIEDNEEEKVVEEVKEVEEPVVEEVEEVSEEPEEEIVEEEPVEESYEEESYEEPEYEEEYYEEEYEESEEYEEDTYYEEYSYSEDDLYILAHLINGEASGQSYTTKLYVGSVVLNRVADGRFPNDIYSVVFQEGQYSCTWDGNYYQEPYNDSWEAARELLAYGSVLPVSVVWQAGFMQGEGLYIESEGEYFCY